MLYAYTVYSAALTPVVLAAFYSKRVTAWGAVAAIASGTVVTLAWDMQAVREFFPPIWPRATPSSPRWSRPWLPWWWSASLPPNRRRSSWRSLRIRAIPTLPPHMGKDERVF